jgi:ABC-type polysaccharide/polyol phosphate export permease
VKAEYGKAIIDVAEGITDWPIWGRLGWLEVKRRYRRTIIGPFWNTLSLGIFVVALGLVWAKLWGQSIESYLPFVSVGVITWNLLSSLITEGCSVFQSNEGLIKQLRVSFTLLIAALVWRNIIVFLHNLVIYVGVVVLFGVQVDAASLLALPGLVILSLNGAWISLLCGMACTRFRDLQPLIGSILQVAVFVTPIFYNPDQLGHSRAAFVMFNPLFHLIDIVRSPLLGNYPAASTWVITGAMMIVGWLVTILLFARFRRRLAFWL